MIRDLQYHRLNPNSPAEYRYSSRYLTPQGPMAFWTPFFPFGLKWKPLLRRHVMISLKTFALGTKTTSSSFIKSIYFFHIFYHFYQFELRISEVWKGKILCALGVKRIRGVCDPVTSNLRSSQFNMIRSICFSSNILYENFVRRPGWVSA